MLLPLSEIRGLAGGHVGDNGSLMKHVLYDAPDLKKAVESLLGEVIVVEREELLGGTKDRQARYVTLKGDWKDRQGVLSIGAGRKGVVDSSRITGGGVDRFGKSSVKLVLETSIPHEPPRGAQFPPASCLSMR